MSSPVQSRPVPSRPVPSRPVPVTIVLICQCLCVHLPGRFNTLLRLSSSHKRARMWHVFLKMSRPCTSGCGRAVSESDGHNRCLACLGVDHAKAAFVDDSCSHRNAMVETRKRESPLIHTLIYLLRESWYFGWWPG
ncbi:hypothetical protein PO909_014379 [Leuciscus waleckii]